MVKAAGLVLVAGGVVWCESENVFKIDPVARFICLRVCLFPFMYRELTIRFLQPQEFKGPLLSERQVPALARYTPGPI